MFYDFGRFDIDGRNVQKSLMLEAFVDSSNPVSRFPPKEKRDSV